VCHLLLISRIRDQNNMGFSNDKKSDDMEYGSQLKAEDTNAQGQTDAVFGEVVEGGPNYRSVCFYVVILTQRILTPSRSIGGGLPSS
jgi:hypothetical protein